MKFILINHSVPVISTFILSMIVSQPAQAVRLNGSFSFMGNSTYLENDRTIGGCVEEAAMKGVPKLDMVTIDAIFSIKKDPFDAKDSFIKFTWRDSNCNSADQEYDKFNGVGRPWMSKRIALTDKTLFDPETWKVKRIEFAGDLDGQSSSSGFFDFTTGTGIIDTVANGIHQDTTEIFKITDFQSKKVPGNNCVALAPNTENRTSASQICRIPEPNSTLSLFALGALGAASTLKRKLNQKSTETTKVS